MRSSKAQIGAALDQLIADVRDDVLGLVSEARRQPEPYKTALMKQAVDTPHRAQAQLAAWIAAYNARNGGSGAATFLASCLVAAGSAKTISQLNADLEALAAQAQTLVTNVQTNGWSWDQVATAIEAQIEPEPAESFDYTRLPIPAGYVTVWNEPW